MTSSRPNSRLGPAPGAATTLAARVHEVDLTARPAPPREAQPASREREHP